MRPWPRHLAPVLALLFVAMPSAIEAQQAGKVYRIGWLGFGPRVHWGFVSPFVEELRGLGWIEGRNIVVEYRSAQGDRQRLADFAVDLVQLKTDVIVAVGSTAALAARQATSATPIVVVGATNPVESGLVSSLARPGGNVTGVANLLEDLAVKQLEALRETVPTLSRLALLWDPTDPDGQQISRETLRGAQRLGVKVQSVEVPDLEWVSPFLTPTSGQLERAFSAMTKERAEGLIVVFTGLMFAESYQILIADLALKHRLPLSSNSHYLTEHGGLMSYLASTVHLHRRAAVYVDKILRGARPGDLPIEQPAAFDLAINLRAAKALGLTVPPSLRLRAGHVIE